MENVRAARDADRARAAREARAARTVDYLLEERVCARCGAPYNERENVGAWLCRVPEHVPLDERERVRELPCDHVQWDRVYGDGAGGNGPVEREPGDDPLAPYIVPPDAASQRAPNEPPLRLPAAFAHAFFEDGATAPSSRPGWRYDAALGVYSVRRCAERRFAPS